MQFREAKLGPVGSKEGGYTGSMPPLDDYKQNRHLLLVGCHQRGNKDRSAQRVGEIEKREGVLTS